MTEEKFWEAAVCGRFGELKEILQNTPNLDLQYCIASWREIDLGTPGDKETDAIGIAKKNGKTEVAILGVKGVNLFFTFSLFFFSLDDFSFSLSPYSPLFFFFPFSVLLEG